MNQLAYSAFKVNLILSGDNEERCWTRYIFEEERYVHCGYLDLR